MYVVAGIEKGENVVKGEYEAEELHTLKTRQQRRERDYTDEYLALLNHLQIPMNVRRALLWALDVEIKS